jgi:hypothetical protein
MTDDLIGEGLRSVQEEIIAKQWPHPNVHLQLLIEVVFYAGATWMLKVIEDEGATPKLFDRLRAELDAHVQKAKAMREALDETMEGHA